jgi:formate dehydrogenase subunit delta
MNVDHLVTMANQIGAFFSSQGTHEEAVDGIADHLKRFWEHRMLQAIGSFVNAGGAALEESGLQQNVVEAVRRLVPPQNNTPIIDAMHNPPHR